MPRLLLIFLLSTSLLACQSSPPEPAPSPAAKEPPPPDPAPRPAGPITQEPILHLADLRRPAPPALRASSWTWQGPGKLTAPILMYHDFSPEDYDQRYTLPTAEFEAQMEWLAENGYTTIPISLLVEALRFGAELPPRPVVITFDDGWRSVYTEAFPVMQRYGFTGVAYLVTDTLGASKILDTEQLAEMIAAGWEIGSHTRTHLALPHHHESAQAEIRQSRFILEDLLGVPVLTFAYPYGRSDEFTANKVFDSGYLAAVGLGDHCRQSKRNLYYMPRIEVRGTMSLEEFAAFMPWPEGPHQ